MLPIMAIIFIVFIVSVAPDYFCIHLSYKVMTQIYFFLLKSENSVPRKFLWYRRILVKIRRKVQTACSDH